ncbi:MAG: hypothetical protein JRG89_00735 [Deltaproteobacteria bacterium]|nr:hypothetical protein [Deltaproteobacteria bacterium]MBW2386934.1 hypothetical protein [Deltaproteobacteria bacterium]
MDQDGESWRALYILALFPLALIVVLRLTMRETRSFDAVQANRGAAERAPGPSDGSGAIVTLLWNSVHIVTGPSVVYYVIFAREDSDSRRIQLVTSFSTVTSAVRPAASSPPG